MNIYVFHLWKPKISVIESSNNWITPNFWMTRQGERKQPKQGLLFLQWGFYEQKYFSLDLFSYRWKGHGCSGQCNWQKSHFACTSLCSRNRVDVTRTLCSPIKDRPPDLCTCELEDDHHWQTRHGGYPQRHLQCSMGMEGEEEKKKEHQGKGPICGGCRQLPGSQSLCSKKRVLWPFWLCFIGQFTQAWPLSWNGEWVLWS